MIKITIEYTTPVRYRLYKLRWLIITLATLCITFDIVNAAVFTNDDTRWTWILLAVFSFLSIVTSFSDLIAHSRSPSPPSTPTLQYRDIPASHEAHGPRSQPSDNASDYERVESHMPGPSQNAIDNEQAGSNSQDEERVAFLPPPASETEKSDDSDGSQPGERPFEPSKIVTILDMILVVSLLAFYVASMVLESMFALYRWGQASNEGYALKVHTMIGTLIIILLHLHCFWLELKALRKQKKGGKTLNFRRGVIRI